MGKRSDGVTDNAVSIVTVFIIIMVVVAAICILATV